MGNWSACQLWQLSIPDLLAGFNDYLYRIIQTLKPHTGLCMYISTTNHTPLFPETPNPGSHLPIVSRNPKSLYLLPVFY